MHKLLIAATLAFSLSGCSTIGLLTDPLLDENVTAQTREYAELIMVGFRKVWIPALGAYHDWEPCSETVQFPCYDKVVYARLHNLTDIATACEVKATAPGATLMSLTSCLGKVSEAKMAFTQAKIAPEGAQ